jgi:hypothetical protein
MASGSRTLKLSILADVDQLKKSLNNGTDDVQKFGNDLEGFAGKAKMAFAAAGVAAAAYAGKLLVDGVKAAIEDEASQLRLANALKNVTGATDAQIKATEDFILKQSLATGVADDQLRPAYERLIRSTKDSAEAQKLTNLALDIAAAKHVDVTTVANALAKANDGQVGALKKLGITLGDNATNLAEFNKVQKALEKAQLEVNFTLEEYGPKSKEYVKASEKLAETQEKSNRIASAGIDVFGELGKEFAGAASESANTFEGKMARLKIATSELQETVGSFILDAITPLVSFVVDKVVPAIGDFISSVSGENGIGSAMKTFVDATKSIFLPIFEALKNLFAKIATTISDNSEAFEALLKVIKFVAPFVGGALKFALQGIADILVIILNTIGSVITAFERLISLGKSIGGAIGGAIGNLFGGGKAAGGSVTGGTTYLVGEQGPELFTPSGNGNIIPNGAFGGGGGIINITVNGAVDAIGTARSIVNVLNQEATLSGGFSRIGQSRLQTV